MNSTVRVNKVPSDYLFRNIASKIPTTVIDLSQIKSSGDNKTLRMPIVQNPRPSTIYTLLIQNEDTEVFDLEQIFDTLNNLVTISPIPMRPKCLLILYSHKDWSELGVDKIARHAWALKILDFSIIKIDTTTNCTSSFNYNPFTNNYSSTYLEASSEVFPDKLNNGNEYSLKLSVVHLPPLLVVRTKSDKEVDITGSQYMYIETVSRKLNFKLRRHLASFRNVTAYLRVNLENNIQNLGAIPLYVSTQLYGGQFIIGSVGNFHGQNNKLVFIVPIKQESKIYWSSDIILYILTFPGIIIVVSTALYLLKLKSRQLNTLHVLQILVGISVPQPRRIVEMVIFFAIVLLSMSYSCTFFSKLTEIKLTYEEQHFRSF